MLGETGRSRVMDWGVMGDGRRPHIHQVTWVGAESHLRY